MVSSAPNREQLLSRTLWLIPVVVSAILFWNTRPGPFVFEEEWVVRKDESPRALDLTRSFLTDYWGGSRVDRDYGPLTHFTYDLNFRLGDSAAAFNLVNVILNAAVAFLVYLLLLELLLPRRGSFEPPQAQADVAPYRSAWLATMGATLYTVLPVHSQTVLDITVREVLLAALAIFGAWWLALKNSPPRTSGMRPENLGLVYATVGAIFLGFFMSESVLIIIPLILVSCWVLGRRIPWWTLGGSMCAFLGYSLVRVSVRVSTFDAAHSSNPLVEADVFTRVITGISLVGRYLAKIVAPFELFVRYTRRVFPVESLTSPVLWAWVLGVVGILTLALWWARKRSNPLLTLAVLFFVLTLLPVVSIFYVNYTIFSEPLAYIPSFAYVLAVCAVLKTGALARFKTLTTLVFCALLMVYGARTWMQNGKWAELDAATLERELSPTAHAWSEVNTAWNDFSRAKFVEAPEEKKALETQAIERIKRALTVYEDFVRGERVLGDMLYRQKRLKAALVRFSRAEDLLVKKGRPERDHAYVLGKRGRCYLELNRPGEAIADFNRCLDARPQGSVYGRRGLAFAALYVACLKEGGVKEECTSILESALADFNKAIELEPGELVHWRNRGYSKFTLGDFTGAIEDYDRGLVACQKKGINYRPAAEGDSVFSFLRQIADVYRKTGEAEQAARTESAAEGIKREAQAERLPPGIGK